MLSSVASVSTKDNNESNSFLEDCLFKSVDSVESVEEFIAFLLLERLNFVMFVDGADVNLLGNNLFVGGAGDICGGQRELSLAFCCLVRGAAERLGASADVMSSELEPSADLSAVTSEVSSSL